MTGHKFSIACTTAASLISLLPISAVAQQSLKERLVGTWTLVPWEQTSADGVTSQQFGAHPSGIAFFDTGGRYIITVMRSDRARYAVDDFGQIAQATAEDIKATALGTITYFGTYSVSEPDSTIAVHVDASSFPNWNGTDLKRSLAITGDELKLNVRPPRWGKR
jgi:Lipocalin-like domain